MARTLAILSAWNLTVPGLLALGFDLSMGGGSFLDVSTYLLAWAWILATPLSAGAALVIAVRLRHRWACGLHGIVLVLWAVTVVFLFLAPGLARLS